MLHDPTPLVIVLVALLLGALFFTLVRLASARLSKGPPVRRRRGR